jgi:hypothetical protein
VNCLHCGATTDNGLALCALCQRKAATVLEFLPVYFRNLARWQPGRAGARPVPGSRVLYDGTVRGSGTGDRISDALDETATALTTWARALTADRGDFPRPLTFANAALCDDLPPELADDHPLAMTWLCAGLEHHLTSVATLEWAGQFVRDLGLHEMKLRALTETWMPGWYAGMCRRQIAKGVTCEAPTYVVPGLTWVTCRACGSTTYARDHLEMVLDEASDWIARPKALAAAIVALVDTEQSVPRLHERIKKWGQRERIASIRHTERGHEWVAEEGRYAVVDQVVGYPRYRLGDVLDVLFAEGATRLGRQQKTPAVS